MKIILTGCSGSVGRVFGAHLVGAGHEVLGVDAKPGDGAYPVYVADLMDPFAIHRAIDQFGGMGGGGGGRSEIGAIVHLANHPRSDLGSADRVLRENLSINTSVFTAAAERGIGRVVFASSVQGVLGGIEREFHGGEPTLPARLPIDETIESRPTNAYGLSKLLSERMLDEMCRMHAERGFGAVSMRLPFVMPVRGFEFNLTRRAPSEQLWGATEAFMYVHVEDAAEAARLACEAEGISGHEVLWIAAPDPRPPDAIEELASRALAGVAGVQECVRRGSFVDISKAERVLGWRAVRVLREARGAGV